MVNTYDYIVKKYNIKTERSYVVDIPNMDRNGLAALFNELNFTEGAEIGVEHGAYSEVLCKANPTLHLSCIDPWSASAYESEIDGIEYKEDNYEQRYQETFKRLKPYNVTIIRQPSMGALSEFRDASLDFVYIDANHDFPNFINDLHNWRRKVRMGGIVAGHDYALYPFRKHNHVKRALDAYARCYRMVPFFVAGAFEYNDKWKRDKFRSWFWVKDR